MNHEVVFSPVGRRGNFPVGTSLQDCARQLGIDIVSICGGSGSCGRCKVRISEGKVSPLSEDESTYLSEDERQRGYRLACRTFIRSDLSVEVPPESLTAPQRTQIEGLQVDVVPDPAVSSIRLEPACPTLQSPASDRENLLKTLKDQGTEAVNIDFALMKELSPLLRENDWKIQIALRVDEVIAAGPPGTKWLGMAVDIGTTKIAGYLLDLETGRTLAARGMMNPQISYGEDVVARIVSAGKSRKDGEKLQKILIDGLNELAGELCEEAAVARSAVVEAVLIGNTAIHHLLLGLPVRQLGMSPYTPVTVEPVEIKARELGLKLAPGAFVHTLANIAGYVGADHVGMLLATSMDRCEEITLAIDIGTNTEICLNRNGRLSSVSCASGPAFEGAHIRQGMRAAEGAIERVRISGDSVEIETIGNVKPIGICGSGLLDAAAQMFLGGVIDGRGKLLDHGRTRMNGEIVEFVLAEGRDGREVTISQLDIRELQLAKAAIRMGIQALVSSEGIEETDIGRVYIAGAFGSYIDIDSAVTIGMLPDLPRKRFEQVGNAAGMGAKMALVSRTERKRANRFASQVRYIELAKMPDFNKHYAKATMFAQEGK